MTTMQNLKEFLLAETIIKDEKLEFNFDEVFKNNEFMKLLKDNATKKEAKNEFKQDCKI